LPERQFRYILRGWFPGALDPPTLALHEVEYLDEIPPAELEVYEDHTREILSHNDAPTWAFSWSVTHTGDAFMPAPTRAGETRS